MATETRLKSGLNENRESIVTALSLLAHATVRNDLGEDRLVKLEAMVNEFETMKTRVDRLETEDA